MLKFLKNSANKALTENSAATYATTNSDCLDLFAAIGALRREPEDEIITRFDRAWAENADIAMKTLFFARDIRGGLGERRVFRTILRDMAVGRIQTLAKNLWAVSEFGRFDDLLSLLDTPAKQITLDYIKVQFQEDWAALQNGDSVSLLGKWLPSINARNANTVRYGRMAAKAFGLTEAEYRKALAALRAKISIIENHLREQAYTFDYAAQPSKAMYKYRKAFLRNDGERYMAYLSSVERGETKIKTETLLPYEIIRPAFGGGYNAFLRMTVGERRSMDVTWKAQTDFARDESALVVVDGSGSMYGGADPIPAAVALSLGIYFSERNKGVFHNHFITFSENPRLVEIKGKDIFDKVKYAASYHEIANTNIQKVFELVLRTAVQHKLCQHELPSRLYIISDMEFDACTRGADIKNFAYAKAEFARHGYILPMVIFWNVASRTRQQPVTMNEKGVVLVSGASPRVFAMVSSGNLSPYTFMMDTLSAGRYAGISA